MIVQLNNVGNSKYPSEQLKHAIRMTSINLSSMQVIVLTCMDNLVESFAQVITQKQFKLNYPQSQCVYSMFALAGIFSGREKAQQIANEILKVYSCEIEVGKYHLRVPVLFDGEIIHEVNKGLNFEKLSSMEKESNKTDFTTIICQDFIKHLKSHADVHFPEDLDYNFNATLFSYFMTDFNENLENVSDNTSYIYYMGIIEPKKNGKYKWKHAWVLEQFYSKTTKQAAYRMYQSWANKITLGEEIKKKGYGFNEEGIWNIKQVTDHIQKVVNFCSYKDRTRTSTLECFGYSTPTGPLYSYTDCHNVSPILTGVGFRYWVDKINPHHSRKNFIQLLATSCFPPYQTMPFNNTPTM